MQTAVIVELGTKQAVGTSDIQSSPAVPLVAASICKSKGVSAKTQQSNLQLFPPRRAKGIALLPASLWWSTAGSGLILLHFLATRDVARHLLRRRGCWLSSASLRSGLVGAWDS